MNYQVIIPMSGKGKRFAEAGYKELKPFIDVNGKPIIDHVRSMYPSDVKVIFICSKDNDSEEFIQSEELKEIDNNSEIIYIDDHSKGPGWAIYQAKDYIDLTLPTFVNYCDFFNIWDFFEIEKFLESEPDGLIFTYKNEHPHTYWNSSYAHVRSINDRVVNIQEKKPFTDDHNNEYKSTGTYYFKTGSMLLKAIEDQIKQDFSLNNEYYISLTYLPLISSGKDIRLFNINYFFQWGTPEDLEDFNWWLNNYKKKDNHQKVTYRGNYSLVVLCGGKGERFVNHGFLCPKPLIPFSQDNLLSSTIDSFDEYNILKLLLSPHINPKLLSGIIEERNVIPLSDFTSGQAESARKAVEGLPNKQPIIIASSDISFKVSQQDNNLLNHLDHDWVVVWVISSNYPFAKRRDSQYSWVEMNESKVTNFSFKKKTPNKENQFALTGTFMFSSNSLAKSYLDKVMSKNQQREPYIDDVIEDLLNDKVQIYGIEITSMECCGTPEEYQVCDYYNTSLGLFTNANEDSKTQS